MIPIILITPGGILKFKKTFLNHKIGWFIVSPYDFSKVSPPGDANGDWSDPETYAFYNPDWSTWADLAEAHGNVGYVILMAKNARGFRFWDAPQNLYNGGVSHAYNGDTVPLYGFDFTIGNSSLVGINTTYIQDGINAFKAKGIKVGLYYNIGRDINYRTNLDGTNSTNSASAAIYSKYDTYRTFVEAEVTHLLTNTTNVDYIWMDAAWSRYPRIDSSGNDRQYQNYDDLQQTIRAANPNCLSIINIGRDAGFDDFSGSFYDGNSLRYFPEDVISGEFSSFASENYPPEKTHNGINYYIPSEYVWSGLYNSNESGVGAVQYPWVQSAYISAGGNSVYSQSIFQSRYDTAKSLGVPFLCNVPIKHDNTLDATYMSRLQNIIL